MATFIEHIQQSKKNLSFLSKISTEVSDCWDWQVTVSFYTALHLINSHIAAKTQANFLTHSRVDEVINPYNKLSVARLDEDIYTSYTKLFQLSRRSRYLLNENYKKSDIIPASLTHSKHVKKSIHHLQKILGFIKKEYKQDFPQIEVKCVDLKGLKFENFSVVE